MIYKDGLVLKYIKSNGKKHTIQVPNNNLFEKQEIPVSLNYLNNYFDCISAILRKKCIIKLKKISIVKKNRIHKKLSNNTKTRTNKTKTYNIFFDESENSDDDNYDNKPKCLLCKKIFKNKYILKKHAIIHTNKRPFKCSKCSMAFKKKYTLVQHERVHSGEKPFSCSKCNMKFSRKAYLESHQSFHSSKILLKCEICKKTLSSRPVLLKHIKSVHGKKLECSICGNTFTRYHDLKIHLEKFHIREEMFERCEICKKTLSTRQILRRHIKCVHGKKLECYICGNTFTRKHDLKRHLEKFHIKEIMENKK